MKKITLKDKETAEELAPRTTVEQVDGLSSILALKFFMWESIILSNAS